MNNEKINKKKEENTFVEESDECNVRVYMRCRPLNSKEKDDTQVVHVEPSRREITLSLKSKKFTKAYTFDGVFSQEQTQEHIYREVASPIVEEVLKGFNCTIFGKKKKKLFSKLGKKKIFPPKKFFFFFVNKINFLISKIKQHMDKQEQEKHTLWKEDMMEMLNSLAATKIVESFQERFAISFKSSSKTKTRSNIV